MSKSILPVFPLKSFIVSRQLVKNCLQCEKPRFDPWISKIPWRRKWQPVPVSVPEESHEQRSLAGYSQSQRVGHN